MFEQNQTERIAERAPRWLVWGLPALCFSVSVLAGTYGTYTHLAAHPDYSGLSAPALAVESVLTGIGFLVINSGPFPSGSTTALPLVFLGRVSGIAFVLSTAVIAVVHVFTRRLQLLELELTHALTAALSGRDAARHTLVCGLTDDSVDLTEQLREDGERVVVLADASDPTAVRDVRSAGAWVLHGPLDDPDTLRKRGKLRLADEVFVATENDRDAVSIVQSLYAVAEDSRPRHGGGAQQALRCYVNLSPSGARRYLHEQVGTGSGFKTRMGERDVLELHTYDGPTATAREILARHPPDPPTATDADSIHVLLVGWSPSVRALVTQLCHVLHVDDHYTRRVTVATVNPEAARAELFKSYPCLDPSNFSSDGRREFVSALFPDVDFVELPSQPERLIAEDAPVTERFEHGQHLTVVFGGDQGLQTGYHVSGVVPRLDDHSARLEMDTEVLYYEDGASGLSIEDGIDAAALERTTLTSFGDFYDGVTPAAVRGTRRDRVAKHVALFYFLQYDYGSAETPTYLNERTDELLASVDATDADAATLWQALDAESRRALADLHWNALSEHYRDANRYAADHAAFKRRVVRRAAERDDGQRPGSADGTLGDSALVDRVAEIEHRRWCAEKLLHGWEPLPRARWTDWEDEETQQRLRAQRYHRDIWPLAELNERAPSEFQKDIDQVQFVLNTLPMEATES